MSPPLTGKCPYHPEDMSKPEPQGGGSRGRGRKGGEGVVVLE